MQEDLITFLNQHPYYGDVAGDRFMEGFSRVRKFFPKNRVTDFFFGRKRVKKNNINADPLYDVVKLDPYVSQHMELLPKIRQMVRDKMNGVRKPYGSYSLPKRSKITAVFFLIKRLTYKIEVKALSVIREQSFPIKLHSFSFQSRSIDCYKTKSVQPDEVNPESKKIKREHNVHIDPQCDEPKELIKVKEEPVNEEDMARLAFYYCLHMKDNNYKMRLSMFVPLREYLDDFLIELLKEIYGMQALVDAGVCDNVLLIIGGVEPNPGPCCFVCHDLYESPLLGGSCPRCEPNLYYEKRGESVFHSVIREAKKKGIRCVVCFRDLQRTSSKTSLINYFWQFVKCSSCVYYYTYEEKPEDLSPHILELEFECNNVLIPRITRWISMEKHFIWRQIFNAYPIDYVMSVGQVLQYIHPYTKLVMKDYDIILELKTFIITINPDCWMVTFKHSSILENGREIKPSKRTIHVLRESQSVFSQIQKYAEMVFFSSRELTVICQDLMKL